jgi:CheY-like chemotaxis protein
MNTLIIDNYEPDVTTLSKQLTLIGNNVSSCSNGLPGIDELKKNKEVDIIFLDIEHGNPDWLEILIFLNESHIINDLSVIGMITHESDRNLVMMNGADQCIFKPFSPIEIKELFK